MEIYFGQLLKYFYLKKCNDFSDPLSVFETDFKI